MGAQITIVGAGHVGVVYGAGLADLGHRVSLVDIAASRVEMLRRGRTWFYEPGLDELLARALISKRISFSCAYEDSVPTAEFIFVCVPTPATADGSLDDSSLRSALQSIRAATPQPSVIVVNKSTVPVGATNTAFALLGAGVRVVSNPEFLAEGSAVRDFFNPARIVIGAHDERTGLAVAEIYRPLGAPCVITDPVTAELTKLASNAFLATKVSFANSIAAIALGLGANPSQLADALSLDPRIGRGHLSAGLGFGGSCLPKDLAAIEHLARRLGTHSELFAAVATVNRGQRARVMDVLLANLGSVASRRIAILGATFKPDTDDVRDSPALALAYDLVELHAEVTVFDPMASHRLSEAQDSGWSVSTSVNGAITGADAVIVGTAWPQFSKLNLIEIAGLMRGTLLIDGRDSIDPVLAEEAGLDLFTFVTARASSPTAPSAPVVPSLDE